MFVVRREIRSFSERVRQEASELCNHVTATGISRSDFLLVSLKDSRASSLDEAEKAERRSTARGVLSLGRLDENVSCHTRVAAVDPGFGKFFFKVELRCE
jgi:hypothetical protein